MTHATAHMHQTSGTYAGAFHFLLFYIKFYISIHHFSQLFRTWFTIIWNKILIMVFLMDSIKLPPP